VPAAPDPKKNPPRNGPGVLRRLLSRDGRDHLWAFLDHLDARPALKRALLIGGPVLLLVAGLGGWGYHRWARTNSVRIARQWLEAGRLDRAGTALQEAIASEPGLPETWRLASVLAWREGNRPASADFARKAAAAGQFQTEDVLAWSEAAILADDAEQAQAALAHLDPATLAASARGLRVAGDVARRGQDFAGARGQFENALRLDAAAGAKTLAPDEVPLGIVCLQTGVSADRTRGQELLSKWAADPQWGVDALRALLADATAHQARDDMARWAEALRLHPRCTLGDIPVCLRAFAEADPAKYRSILATLEERSRATPGESAELLGWLVQIGQGAEALRWSRTLDPRLARTPPLAPAVAEALRATGRWQDLQDWVDHGEWGHDVGFLGSAYGFLAARRLGNGAKADEAWRGLRADGGLSPAHAYFAGESLYAWGFPREAAELLWAAAERPDLAFQALGSLARLYQEQRDAAGEYRAFSRLHAMRASDRGIANNFAYFAALTDLGSQGQVLRVAEDNSNGEPSNATYRSTYAFVLVWSGQAPKALEVMAPLAHAWHGSPAVAFAYGAALAGAGRKPEAREVFNSLNPRDLGPQEIGWIEAALR
jgi:hypothetical protein